MRNRRITRNVHHSRRRCLYGYEGFCVSWQGFHLGFLSSLFSRVARELGVVVFDSLSADCKMIWNSTVAILGLGYEIGFGNFFEGLELGNYWGFFFSPTNPNLESNFFPQSDFDFSAVGL
ncbi:hypothetical protein VIGAN_11245800, partial [Vigna angularis var. angularis]